MSYRAKGILLGNANSGKTSILSVYVNNEFHEKYQQTIGANFLIKEIDLHRILNKLDNKNPELIEKLKNKEFKLYFWDLGGQKDKLFANEYYFDQAYGAIIVFDIVNRKSFEDLDFWISKLKELSGDVPFIIVGNKSDEINKKEVSTKEAKEKAAEFGVEYIETSAKLNENVVEAFEMLAIKILNNIT